MLYFTPLLEERGLSALLKGTLMPAWWYWGLNFVPVTQSLAMVWFLLKHLTKIWCFVLYFQDTLCLCKNPGFICAFEVGVWQLTSHKMPPKIAVCLIQLHCKKRIIFSLQWTHVQAHLEKDHHRHHLSCVGLVQSVCQAYPF